MSADVDAEGIDMGPDEFAGDDGARFKPADVDAAREALQQAILRDHRAEIDEALDAFEAAIRAEGLDVERLARALRAVGWWPYLEDDDFRHIAPGLAAEYARLADAER